MTVEDGDDDESPPKKKGKKQKRAFFTKKQQQNFAAQKQKDKETGSENEVKFCLPSCTNHPFPFIFLFS